MKNKIIKLTASISLYNVYASIYVRSMKHSLGKAYFNSESLRDNCITHRKYKIWDTPHYKFLNKKPYLYFNYINKTDQMDHSVEKFDALSKDYDKNKSFNSAIAVNYKDGMLTILDGVHRLAIHAKNNDGRNISIKDFKFNEDFKYEIINDINITNYEKIIRDELGKYKNRFFKSNSWGIGNEYQAGYHSINFFGLKIPGQRDCNKRISKLSQYINFSGKSVVDFGCNTGGMLFSIKDPSFCLGLDYDNAAIQVAKKISLCLKESGLEEYANRFEFSTCNFDKTNYDKLLNHLAKKHFDIALLGSLGSWVREWRSLYAVAFEVSKIIIFEENNALEGVEQINFFKTLGAKITQIIVGSDDDSTGNNSRNTYLIEHITWQC